MNLFSILYKNLLSGYAAQICFRDLLLLDLELFVCIFFFIRQYSNYEVMLSFSNQATNLFLAE